MAQSKLFDAGFGTLPESMGVSGTLMIDSFHGWGDLSADGDEDAMWQDGSPWLRIRYMSRSSSWLAGDLDTTGGGSLETDLGESFLEGWIQYLLALLIGGLQETLCVDDLQDYILQGTVVHILVWDPGIRVIGSPVVDGVEIRVEQFPEELTEDLLHMIVLLIRSILGACVASTLRDHVLRGEYFMSHRWIWDPGIIHSLIQLLLEDKQYSSREDCNVPIFGFPYVTVWDACQSSQLGVIVSSGSFEELYGAQLTLFIIFHHQDPFCTTCPWFRCIPTISIILGYY
jgi:hypothetical protein